MGDITEYVTTAQAAALLGVSKSRVDQFCRDGRLPFVLVGTARAILRADVETFAGAPRQKRGRKPAAKKRRKP
jgi:excisionase family DNA binding protein